MLFEERRCIPSETCGRNGVTPIFRSFHRTDSSTTGGWSRWYILMCFFLYIIQSTMVSFLEDTRLFLQGLLFFSFLCIFCMCVMYLTSLTDSLLMTDGLNAV